MKSKEKLVRSVVGRNFAGLLITAMLLGFTITACGGESNDGPDTSLDTPTTRVRTLENIQAVFDLMPKQAHNDMMEMMGGPDSIRHDDHAMHSDHTNDSHFVMLTIMDVAARGATITDADVAFSVTGPDGQSLAEGGHVMSGKGMHHYAVGFAGGEPGTYKIGTKITRGEKTYTETVQFEITE